MDDAWLGNPPFNQTMHPFPVEPVSLTAAHQTTTPQPTYPFPKHVETVEVSRHGMIVEVPSYNRFEPLSRLRHRIIHTPTKLLFHFL